MGVFSELARGGDNLSPPPSLHTPGGKQRANLNADSTVAFFATVQTEGNRMLSRHNL